jgi:hypothetical protein
MLAASTISTGNQPATEWSSSRGFPGGNEVDEDTWDYVLQNALQVVIG